MPSGWAEDEKRNAVTLFFSVVRLHFALLPLRLSPLRVCLYGYRRVLCLPNTAGGSLRCSSPSPLRLSLPSILPCYCHSVLSLTTMCYLTHDVSPSILLFERCCQNSDMVFIRQQWFVSMCGLAIKFRPSIFRLPLVEQQLYRCPKTVHLALCLKLPQETLKKTHF